MSCNIKFVSDDTKQVWHDLMSATRVMTDNHKVMFYTTLCLWILRGVLSVCVPIVAAIVMSKLQDSLNDTQLTLVMIGWIVLDVSLPGLESRFSEVLMEMHSGSCEFYSNGLFINSFKRVLKIPLLAMEGQQSAKIIANINQLNNAVSSLIGHCLRWLGFLVPFVLSIIILLVERWSFAVIGLSFWILGTLVNRWVEKTFSRDGELSAIDVKNSAEKTDQLDNLVNINALNLQDTVTNSLFARLEKYAHMAFWINLKRSLMEYIPSIICDLPIVIVAILAAEEVLETKDLGRFILLTGMVSTMIGRGMILTSFLGWIVRKIKQYHKLMESLTYDNSLDLKSGKEKLPMGGSIELKKVCFTYPEEKMPVLDGLSLKIKQGEHVAIIGNSGMGKSTLINVMQHAYEIQDGSVIINGKNVRQVSLKSLKDKITYINQHPVFWTEKNIRANLLMFNPKATEVDLYQALNSANLLDEITCKEKGIDSKVTALSAGQKQRLALARAFLRKTPIIIMDEPTANLDTVAQGKVLHGIQAMNKNTHKMTVVFASNVPAEIASAERIILLEHGKIVEDGTPAQLMSDTSSKTYKRLRRYVALFEEHMNKPVLRKTKQKRKQRKGVKHG